MRNVRRWPLRFAPLLVLAALGICYASLHVFAGRQLGLARAARRADACAEAERLLASCWRLPGLRGAIGLERLLAGIQQGDMNHEADWRARTAARSPTSVLILEALAKGNLAIFRWNEARADADALLERQPDDAQGLWLRGRALLRVQQEERALEDFQSALRHDPSSFEIRLSLADLLQGQGFVREAIAHYEWLRDQRPDDARVVVGLARAWQENAGLDMARRRLDEFLKSDASSVAALAERGRVALRLGQPGDGEQWLRKALAIRPDHADGSFVLKLCLEAEGKTDDELQRRISEAEQSQVALRSKLRLAPRDPALFLEVGRWMLRTGQEQEAAGWFFLALREDKNYAPAHAALADYFARAGQPLRSLAHRRLAGSGATAPAPPRVDRIAADAAATAPPTRPGRLPPLAEASGREVHDFCGACHTYPPPESMPRFAWRKEVKQGFDLWRDSKMQGQPPALESIVLHYESRAPDRLPVVDLASDSTLPPVRFEGRGAGWLAGVPPFPGVATVSLAGLFHSQRLELLACDTRIDRVMLLKPYEARPAWQLLAEVAAPCHAAVVDLNADGHKDILVASLGQFFPTDDKVGSVVWLRAQRDGSFQPVTLLDGVGRVADVEAGDFNGDGRLDLIVAVFGWRKTGEILYLENRTTDWSQPRFEPHRLDERHGVIHVPVVDLNHDGRPDFVALISQEHETVVAFVNAGDGCFQKETLFAAPHPSYGVSGIQVVDLDGDGDHDVLLTNGDVLDRPYVLKPYHGVQWLENEGAFPFDHHPLLPLAGASRAIAADFDGDDDLDIVAVSFLPRVEFPDRQRLPSMVLLEQAQPGRFLPHVLETGTCDHFTCAAGDWDGDGRIDLATGNFSWKRSQAIRDAAMLWKNTGRKEDTR